MSLTLTTLGWLQGLKTTLRLPSLVDLGILFMNRNARVPKKANHGARPCSSVMRREKRYANYRRWRRSTPPDHD